MKLGTTERTRPPETKKRYTGSKEQKQEQQQKQLQKNKLKMNLGSFPRIPHSSWGDGKRIRWKWSTVQVWDFRCQWKEARPLTSERSSYSRRRIIECPVFQSQRLTNDTPYLTVVSYNVMAEAETERAGTDNLPKGYIGKICSQNSATSSQTYSVFNLWRGCTDTGLEWTRIWIGKFS